MRKNIQVLWVENDPLVTSAYPREAELSEGIELHPFPCWEDAESELERNYNNWDAIILDAKCQFRRGDADKAERFLVNVFKRIEKLASSKNRTIPWYVLSGQGEDDIRELISVDNEWDDDWADLVGRRFYSKNGLIEQQEDGKKKLIHERHILYRRIKNQVIHYNPELQIEYNYYPDVFASLDRLGLEAEVGYHLMHLLMPIHFPGTSYLDYNNRYIELRKALEYIFRHMVNSGILPGIIIGKDEKEGVNLSWSSLFLGAKQPENPYSLPDTDSSKRFWKKVKRNIETPLLPKQLSKWLKETIFQTGGAAHASEAAAEIKLSLDKYLPLVGGSPYMLRSLTMGLCDFILWYNNFLQANPDKEMNAVKFWTLRNQKY